MTTITDKITIYSEEGDRNCSATIEARMDSGKPECHVTLYVDDKPVFSMGNDEIDDFCKALQSMSVNN
jgi:hypothetical protein